MKISDYRQFELEFDCEEVREFLFLYVLDRGDLSLDERWAIESHLDGCTDCQKEYEQTKFVNDALIANQDYLVQEGVFEKPKPEAKFKQLSDDEADFLQFQAKMQRAIARRKKAEHQDKWIRSRYAVKISSAVAACLIAAIGIYLTVSQLTGSENTSAPTAAVQHSKGSVKIELLTDSGSEIIPAGQPIIASSNLKTLRINDNRQMVLNAGTKLSIVPHDLGCIVKFDKGEIYTEVEHDGKPFIVETIHGRAIITGTTFNIKTDDKQMELVVAEGTVSFENKNGSVNVTAGHKSLLALNSKPTKPLLCDTRQLTAWVTDDGTVQEIASTTSCLQELVLYPSFGSELIDLESIDYDSWIEGKREWFKREFPHIFRFKNALAKEGIEKDYPELLIKSGDLWRFAYPEKTSTQLIPVSHKSMADLASAFGKNKQWLSDNLRISQTYPAPKDEAVSLKAFDRWVDALESTTNSSSQMSSELLTYSLHASVYLSETRTLAWLALSNGHISVTAIEKSELLKLLEQEIKAASSCVKQFKQLFVCDDSPNACDEYEHRYLLYELIEGINTIAGIERNLTEYEAIRK